MKRLIGNLMVLLLLLICLCGCNSTDVNSVNVNSGENVEISAEDVLREGDKIGDLDLKAVKKIKEDFLGNESYKYELNEVALDYFCTLSDGSKVIEIKNLSSNRIGIDLTNYVTDYIAEEYVHKYNIRGIYKQIHKNGKVVKLKEAYDNGLISKKVLDEFFEKFPEENLSDSIFNDSDYFGDLSFEQIGKSKERYFNYQIQMSDNVREAYGLKSAKEIIVKNCGRLSDGTVILKFTVNKTINNPIVYTDEIAEYKYNHIVGNEIQLYVENTRLTGISAAYGNKYISKEVLDELFDEMPELQ